MNFNLLNFDLKALCLISTLNIHHCNIDILINSSCGGTTVEDVGVLCVLDAPPTWTLWRATTELCASAPRAMVCSRRRIAPVRTIPPPRPDWMVTLPIKTCMTNLNLWSLSTRYINLSLLILCTTRRFARSFITNELPILLSASLWPISWWTSARRLE